MMSLANLLSGLWSFLVGGLDRIAGWLKLQTSLLRSLGGLVSLFGLSGIGIGLLVHSVAAVNVQGVLATSIVDGTSATEVNASLMAALPWLRRANIVLPVSEGITVGLGLVSACFSAAWVKISLWVVRRAIPAGG